MSIEKSTRNRTRQEAWRSFLDSRSRCARRWLLALTALQRKYKHHNRAATRLSLFEASNCIYHNILAFESLCPPSPPSPISIGLSLASETLRHLFSDRVEVHVLALLLVLQDARGSCRGREETKRGSIRGSSKNNGTAVAR